MSDAIRTIPFCGGFGQYHTDKPSSPDPKPYNSITFDDIVSMVKTPSSTAKDHAQWFIPSTLLTREAEKQRANGFYYAVWCDFDEHTELDAIKAILASLVCSHIVYSSRSAIPDRQKWRVIIFLAHPANATEWQQIAAIINDRFEAAGIVPDRASERVNQICYLPNRGEFYQFHIEHGALLDWQTTLASEIVEKQRQAADNQARLNGLEERSRLKAIERMATGSLSPIEAYNAEYPLAQCLEIYGYKRVGKKWLSPNSESGNAGVSIQGNRWTSSHGSDGKIGRPNKNGGGCNGDAFDLFIHYEHGGDRNAALIAAGDMFTVNGKTLSKANQTAFKATQSTAKDLSQAVSDNNDPPFRRVSLHDVFTNPSPPQKYVWGGRVPFEALTLLAAHGGTGKSLFGLQLAAHTAAGKPFLGLPTERAKTLFFSAEDSTGTIRRRMAGICGADNLDPAEVDNNLIVLDATDAPCLFHEKFEDGVKSGAVSAGYSELKAMIEAEGVAFLIVDNASDTYGANPVDRQAVTQFIRALVKLVQDAGGAVLLLAHVNKATSSAGDKQTNTEGYADSAAWHNAARSRLFLNANASDGTLTLAHQKNNYGLKQPDLNMVFRDDGSSLYAPDAGHIEQSAAAKAAIRQSLRQPLLVLIHEFYSRGEWISPSTTSPTTNAHAKLKDELGYPFLKNKDGKADCFAVLRDCEREGLLTKEKYEKPDRHHAERWALTEKGLNFISEAMPDEAKAA